MKIGEFDLIQEYKFHPKRKWLFDYAIPEFKIAIEVEGGLWIQGRHNRAKGYINDMEKYNAASVLGWHILRYTPQQFNSYLFIEEISCLIKLRGIKLNDILPLLKNLPPDQAIQTIKSALTGQPITSVIEGDLYINFSDY